MGSCLCKKTAHAGFAASVNNTSRGSSYTMSEPSESVVKRPKLMETETIEQLILEMLQFIGTVQQISGEEPPAPLVKINEMADSDEGWCDVVMQLVHTIPLDDPLGPSAITIIFEDCPLPARDTVLGFIRSLNLNRLRCQEAYESIEAIRKERNLLVMYGSIGEKFAGVHAITMLDKPTLIYLLTFLTDAREPNLVLHSLLALEKFARMSDNKALIERVFSIRLIHPLLPLELYHDSSDFKWRQVGFCARWALDNTFLFPGRKFSFETFRNYGINANLNAKDVSEYLKISPDGLEARCDSNSFESVRGSFQIDAGCWYYEAIVITAGVMQIGWATKKSTFQNHDGYGVGDDSFSLAYDGCRRLIWHKAEATPKLDMPCWKPGDILGCLIDVGRKEAIFSLNGRRLPPCTNIFLNSREGFFAAASFMAFQQCRFNFGSQPFEFPPVDRQFSSMNERGRLTDEQKKIIPRRLMNQKILEEELNDKNEQCAVCYDFKGAYEIEPCRHGNFCNRCIMLLESCPFCRCAVREFYLKYF